MKTLVAAVLIGLSLLGIGASIYLPDSAAVMKDDTLPPPPLR